MERGNTDFRGVIRSVVGSGAKPGSDLNRKIPVRVSLALTGVLVALVKVAGESLGVEIDEGTIQALLGLLGAGILGDTLRPSGKSWGGQEDTEARARIEGIQKATGQVSLGYLERDQKIQEELKGLREEIGAFRAGLSTQENSIDISALPIFSPEVMKEAMKGEINRQIKPFVQAAATLAEQNKQMAAALEESQQAFADALIYLGEYKRHLEAMEIDEDLEAAVTAEIDLDDPRA